MVAGLNPALAGAEEREKARVRVYFEMIQHNIIQNGRLFVVIVCDCLVTAGFGWG